MHTFKVYIFLLFVGEMMMMCVRWECVPHTPKIILEKVCEPYYYYLPTVEYLIASISPFWKCQRLPSKIVHFRIWSFMNIELRLRILSSKFNRILSRREEHHTPKFRGHRVVFRYFMLIYFLSLLMLCLVNRPLFDGNSSYDLVPSFTVSADQVSSFSSPFHLLQILLITLSFFNSLQDSGQETSSILWCGVMDILFFNLRLSWWWLQCCWTRLQTSE